MHAEHSPVNLPNSFAGELTDIGFLGGVSVYKVRLNSGVVLRVVTSNATRSAADGFAVGQKISVSFRSGRRRGAGPMSTRKIFTRPARIAALAPYLWMLLFFLVPFGFVLKIALSQTAIAQPPYVPVFDVAAGWDSFKSALAALSSDNFRLLASDDLYILSYVRSLVVALSATAILLLIGYPVAYGMSRLPQRWQLIAMMLVIIPFWTSFLIRIYAWINILQRDGLLNKILLALGHHRQAAGLACDRCGNVSRHRLFLFPVHDPAALRDVVEDGRDVAGSCRRSRLLAQQGILAGDISALLPSASAAGVLLCFIPIVGEFVIPDLLAGSGNLMIGQTLVA